MICSDDNECNYQNPDASSMMTLKEKMIAMFAEVKIMRQKAWSRKIGLRLTDKGTTGSLLAQVLLLLLLFKAQVKPTLSYCYNSAAAHANVNM